MGRIDYEVNHFFRDDQAFADLINLCIYQGEQIVQAKNLEDADTVSYPKDEKGKRKERRADVTKRYRDGIFYQIYCLENESKVSYTMPVRNMEYEAARYREQLRRIAREHNLSDYRDWDEYSSGFTREDRLQPVITLVLYWKREPWDGAKTLRQMLALNEEKEAKLSPFLQDYHLNLINMYDLENVESCQGQLKYVLKLLQRDTDRQSLYDEVQSNPEYERLDAETGKLLSVLLGDEELQQRIEENNEKGGTLNMCKALDDLRAEAKAEGLEQGRAEGIERGRAEGIERGRMEGMRHGATHSRREIVQNLLRDGTLPLEKIALLTGLAQEEVRQLAVH